MPDFSRGRFSRAIWCHSTSNQGSGKEIFKGLDRGPSLAEFLGSHEQPGTFAFLHYDFQPSLVAPYGSWFFHYLRMRTPVARHDGVLSAARAHDAETLTEAARRALPGFASGIYGSRIWKTRLPRVFHTLLGIRRPLVAEFRRQLGVRVIRLGELE